MNATVTYTEEAFQFDDLVEVVSKAIEPFPPQSIVYLRDITYIIFAVSPMYKIRPDSTDL